VRRAIGAQLGNKELGRDVHALVVDVASGRTLFDLGDGSATPASTMKLLTSTAALQLLGPDHRFRTTVVRRGSRVTLVGGGDPLLARKADPEAWPRQADLTTLARRTASALRADGVRRIRLGYDATLFTGPAASPVWEPGYVRDGVVSPISALWVDEGRAAGSYSRVADPAATAATEFAVDLRKAGITVAAKVAEQSGVGHEVSVVESPPLSQVVEHTLSLSDNEAAEVLARQVGVAAGSGGSFSGAVTGITRTLEGLGVDLDGAHLNDGSGLARSDRLDPRTIVDVLRAAADHDRLRSVLTGLPVAGFTGSLAYRFEDVPAAGVGRVRAKTGTLTGVSALAGLVQTPDGRELAFVVNADKVKLAHTLDARDALDRIAARLAAAA
jgi:D-alanyl-D-alanine carboxypeptidase/D-alanyl-D-alanine-endopeptidase (penicillin-binding protein 4)